MTSRQVKVNLTKGVRNIVVSNIYQSGTGPYTSTYTTAFTSDPNVGVAIPTIDVAPTQLWLNYKVNLPQSTNRTHIKITMNYIDTPFKNFRVTFLAVIGTLTYLKVDYISMNNFTTTLNTGSGVRSDVGNFNLGITVNAANTLSIIPYLSGLKVYTTGTDYAFGLTFTKNTNNNLIYNATV